MKILFIKNSHAQTLSSWIGNGIGIIATIAHNEGYDVKVIDNNALYKVYEDKDIIKIIKSFKPDVLAYSITLHNSYPTYQQIPKIKSLFPSLVIVGGGIHMKYCFEEALHYGVDIVINREGEKVILPLLKHLEKRGKEYKKGLEKIAGVSFVRENGKFYFAKEFPMLKNLDEVPIVNYKLFNIKDFIRGEVPESGVFVLTGQRGCPFRCTFCSDEIQRADNRVASAEWMFKNVKDLYENYNVQDLFIGDNNITLFKERLTEFCEKMINSGLNKKVSLTCQTTTRFPIDEELIKLMKDAGFNKVVFGIERLTPYSLKMINKEQSLKIIEDILSLVRKHNVEPSIFAMVGFPFETKELLEEEMKLFLKLTKYAKSVYLSVLTPIPGTIYYDEYPKIKEWYLDKEEYLIRKTYFTTVLDGSVFHSIKKNFFNLSKETQKAMIYYYHFFKEINQNSASNNKIVFLLRKVNFLIAKISQVIFAISPPTEFMIFKKLRILRHKNRSKCL